MRRRSTIDVVAQPEFEQRVGKENICESFREAIERAIFVNFGTGAARRSA